MNDAPALRGSCHCGAVCFTVRAPIRAVFECNCSYCSRAGALWALVTEPELEVTRCWEDLALYQFNTFRAKHYFCRTCGIGGFSRPRIDPGRWAVNVRCLEGFDLAAVPRYPFDGINWEAAAQAVRARVPKVPSAES